MTHDYKRHGTTTLFAAPNVLDGRVIGRCMQQHRHKEFVRLPSRRRFRLASWCTPSSTITPPTNIPRSAPGSPVTLAGPYHFTPTSASWLNAVEGFFAKLTKRRLKRGVFHSIVSLQTAIKRFLEEAYSDPKPFQWTKDPSEILAAKRAGLAMAP